MARIGLVLGAGGLTGQAYHAGVLAALEHDLGWDPRTADVIVGSSAGSLTGAALRLGVPARDLASWAVESPLSPEGEVLAQAFQGGEQPDLPPFDPSSLLRPWRLPSPYLVGRLARRPAAFRAMAAASTLLPDGVVDLLEHTAAFEALVGDSWPEADLWICAARRSDGRRVVFGRPGAPPASLAKAVAASCAIPGYFAPVRIGERRYIDGGVHSPTNVDVLARSQLDLVVVVSPMSSAGGRVAVADAPMRWANHARLDREVKALRKVGTEVVRIEPTKRVLAAMGVNAMADDRAARVVQAAFLDTGRYTTQPRIAGRLALLATRPSRARGARRGAAAVA